MATEEAMPLPPPTPSLKPSLEAKPAHSLEVVELTEEQMPEFQHCVTDTFSIYEMEEVFFPEGKSDERMRFHIKRGVEDLKTSRGVHYLGIYSEDKSRLMAAAKWRLEDEETLNEPEKDPKNMMPPGVNVEAFRVFFAGISKARTEIMGLKKSYWRKL